MTAIAAISDEAPGRRGQNRVPGRKHTGDLRPRSYAAEPEILIKQLRKDEAIAEADTLLLTVPNQLGVAYKCMSWRQF